MLILLITHIVIALSGIAVAAASLFNLSPRTIRISHILTAGTLATGTGLVFMNPGSLLKSCLSGLFYLAVILTITGFAQYRLAAKKVR